MNIVGYGGGTDSTAMLVGLWQHHVPVDLILFADPGGEQPHTYRNASVKGTIGTIPETPGLAVWKSGHIGVYIGNGEVIEAMGTHYGVVKTQLADRNWTAWLEIPYIQYD